MEESGEIRRVSKRKDPKQKYQYNPVSKPSESKASIPTVTLRDMNMAVGAQRLEKGREQQDLERLIGFCLVAEGTAIPENGYLA